MAQESKETPKSAAAKKPKATCPKPSGLTFTRRVGTTSGVLRWRAPAGTRRYRVLRNGKTVGQTRRRALRIAVRLDRSYRLAVVPLTGIAREATPQSSAPGAPRGVNTRDR